MSAGGNTTSEATYASEMLAAVRRPNWPRIGVIASTSTPVPSAVVAIVPVSAPPVPRRVVSTAASASPSSTYSSWKR